MGFVSLRVVSVFFQAEDGIRDLVRSRGLGDVYKRQEVVCLVGKDHPAAGGSLTVAGYLGGAHVVPLMYSCLLYTSDAADERSSVDLGGRRIIKKKNSHI
mgnify:CR=1 FL=1